MELIVYWTKFAEQKLDDIFDYYEFKANAIVARNLIIGIIDTSLRLSNNPQIGKIEELLSNRPQAFRYLVYKNYKIIYWINKQENRIEIVNVFDTRQNPIKMSMFSK